MFNTINEDLKLAMKNGNKFELSVLRMLKSALQLETINQKKDLEDALVIQVLKKQVKQRNDALVEYEKLGKIETVNNLKEEINIINRYLPEEASLEKIEEVVEEAIKELNPTSMKDMGRVMKFVTEHLENADMTKVSQIVKERLVK